MTTLSPGWRVVGGAFTAQMFVIGFFTYAVSLLVAPVREEFGVSLEQVMYSLTVGTILYALGLLALANCTSIWQYIVVFGLTMALANAFACALTSSAVISRWFTRRRGMALGIAAIARNPNFWLIGMSLGLLFASYTATLSNLSSYAINLGQSEERASTLIMAVAIFGLIGKLLFGMAADRISLKVSLGIAQGMVIAALLLLSAQPGYGLMGPVITLSVMPSFPIMGGLFDATGSYTSALYLFAAAVALGAALLIPLRLPEPL